MKKEVLLLVGVSVLTACAQRAPTLNTPVGDPAAPPPVEKAEDWKDWGPEQNKKNREAAIGGTRLNAAQIDKMFRGRVLRGCYPNGSTISEYLAEDGKFYDGNQNNQYLGTWSVTNAQLCFKYPERAQQGQPDVCFVVIQDGSRVDFYTPNLRDKVASTQCPKAVE